MVAIYKAVINKVNQDVLPNTVDLKKYNNVQPIVLGNGITITQDPIIKDVKLLEIPCFNVMPIEGDEVLVLQTDDGLTYAYPLDLMVKFLTTAYNPVLGNFMTKNVLKFKNNEIIIGNRVEGEEPNPEEDERFKEKGTKMVNIDAAESVSVNSGDINVNGENVSVNNTNTNITSSNVNVTAETTNIDGMVNLGGGGNAVAMVGSDIQVTITGGPAAGTWMGKIMTGSSKVTVGA